MALPTIIAVNQTGGALLLTRLGLTVPASSSLTISNFAYRDEIWGDESLYAFVVSGDIKLNLGQGELSTADSLKYWNLNPFQPAAYSVRALRDSNVAALSGTITVDGVNLVAGDRVLLTAQGTASQNGIWVVQAGAWARPDDFGVGQAASGIMIEIEGEGATYANNIWVCSTAAGSDVIDTDNLSFVAASGGTSASTLQQAYEAGNTITTSAAEGNLTFTTGAGAPIEFVLTGDDFTVNGANDVNFGGGTALATFNLDTTGAITVDSSGAGISLDGAGVSNFSTSSGDLTLAATTNSVIITGAEGAVDAIQLNATTAGGGIDINGGTGGITVDTSGALSLDGTGTAANLTLTANAGGTAALVLSATNAGAGAGNINVTADDNITLDTAAFSIDGTAASNLSVTGAGLTLSTITSGTLAVTSAGALNLTGTTGDWQASGALTIDSSGGAISIGGDADAQAINVGTGAAARVITVGNVTGATGVTVRAGTGNITLQAPRTTITGDLVVQGTTTSVDSETVLIADNHLYLNQGYTTAVAVTGGLAVNYLPIATATNVAAGGFVAGVAAVSNPTVATVGAATFAAGQFIQISGANDPDNNGLYEVLSHAANVLTVRGVGVTATVEDFSQNQFTTDTTVAGTITRITVSVNRAGTDGIWEAGSGATTGITFRDFVTTGSGGTLTLQNAYNGGNTITTAGATPIAFTLTSGGFTVDGASAVSFGGATPVTSFNLDATGGVTIDGGGASNFSTTAATLTIATVTSGTLAVSSAGALNLSGTTGDWQASGALTIDSSGGAISIGSDADAQAINVGTGAAARTITVGNTTGATSLVLNAGTGNIDIGTTAQARATNIATGAAAQALIVGSTNTTSATTLNSGSGAFTINAGGIVDLNATGAVTIDGTGVSIDGTAASNLSVTGAGLTLSTITSGTLAVTSAGALNLSSTTGDWQASGALTLDSTGGPISIGGDADAQAINIGTGAAARTVTIGNVTGASRTVINAGTGSSSWTVTGAGTFDLNAGTGAINIATNATDHSLLMGSGTGVSAQTHTTGTGAYTINAGGIFDLNATGAVTVDGTSISIDGTAASNLSVTGAGLTLSTITSGTLAVTSAGALNLSSTTGDWQASGALTIDSSGGAISIGSDANAQAINVGTGAAARAITVGNVTGATGVTVNTGTEGFQVNSLNTGIITDYGKSAANPTARGGGFQDGDRYYNTVLSAEMRYDSTRSKWLSVDSDVFFFGRNGNTAVSAFYRGVDSRVMSATSGFRAPFAGTVVAVGYTRTDTDAATFDVVEGGVSRATLASSAVSGGSNALDGNFSAGGILAVQNQAGGNITSSVSGWVRVKYRV